MTNWNKPSPPSPPWLNWVDAVVIVGAVLSIVFLLCFADNVLGY